MECLECGKRLGVFDTVYNPEFREVLRRRKCSGCGKIICTAEFEVEPDERFKKDWKRSTKQN